MAETAPESGDSSKRKSVSFVDEKLIINAMKSTVINNKNDDGDGKKINGQKKKSFGHQDKPRQRPPSGGRSTNGPGPEIGDWRESCTGNSSRKNSEDKKAVIIYYNDPDLDIKKVDDLLMNKQEKKSSGNFDEKRRFKYPGKNQQQQQPHSNGSHNDNHHHHHPDQNYSSRPYKPGGNNHHHHPHNGSQMKNVGHFKKNNLYQKQQQPNQKKKKQDFYKQPITDLASGQSESEPIVIYYNDANVSLEENLAKLLSAGKKTGNDDGDVANYESEEKKNDNNGVDDQESKQDDSSSQAVIQPDVPIDQNDEDVISGGAAIENPRLPSKPGQLVICTIVSHPGHFYVKFVDDANEKQLRSMTGFYQNDEQHIELTVDVLRPGQYFAACRAGQWIRVKVLHVDADADLINCLLIDEGCCGTFKLGDLQPLYNRFRSVPKQAVRVALSGVRPKEADWLPAQALEFKKLVENKQLRTGVVSDQQPESWDEQQSSIEIELFFADQGEFQDQSVADILVQRDIAMKKL